MAECDISGTVYDQSGELATDARLTITPLSISGTLLSSHARTVRAVAGLMEFTEVQGTTVRIQGDVLGFVDGVNVVIPSSLTATLAGLASIPTVTVTGLTIQDEGVSVAGLYGTLNFVGTGVTAVQASAGIATITITAGAGVTAEEVDGTPTYPSSSTLRFDQADGFVLTQPGANIARVDLANVPLSVLAALPLTASNNLSDLVNAVTARTNLGLGTLATQSGTFSGSSSGTNTGDQTTVSGNAGTATALATARNINGEAFDGTANITVTAAAGTLSGTTLASGVTASSLTSFGVGIALGTPASGVLTNATGLPPVTGIVGWPADASGVLTNDGAGVLSWGAGGSGANAALSNLASVAINTDLLPASNQSLGSATLPWLSTFTGSAAQYESVVSSAGLITHAALGSATNISLALTTKGAASVFILPGTVTAPGIRLQTSQVDGIYGNAPGSIDFSIAGVRRYMFQAAGFYVNNTTGLILLGGTFEPGIARNGVGQVQINNGVVNQWGSLFVGTRDAGTATVTNGLTTSHQSTGTPAAGFGTAILCNSNSSASPDRAMSQFKSVWHDATDATRTAWVGLATNVTGSTTLIDRFITGPRTTLVDATATSLFEIALPTLTGASGVIEVTIYATDGTDSQVRSQIIRYSGTNKAAVYTSEIVIVSEAASCSAGTLTAAWSIVTGTNKITIKVTADTSLASTTSFYATYTLKNNSQQAVTIL